MGSFASPGIGSGLNVNQLVSQLVAAERAPTERRIARQEADARADVTGIAQVRAAFTALQSAANALDGPAASVGRRAVVQQGAGFTATASTAAVTGRYSIEVQSLATAEKRQGPPRPAADDLGTGTLTFTVGTEAFEVTLGPTTTVAQLRDAINTATGGRGLTATVVNGDAGSVLVLNASTAGSAGAISIASSGTISTYASGLAVTTPATDSVVRVDGVTRTSATNRLTDLISGVTVDLTKAEVGTSFSLDIGVDSTSVRGAVQAFLTAYNGALSALRTVGAVGVDGAPSGPLAGDSSVRALQQQLRGAVGGAFGQLSGLGLRSTVDGTLSLDTAKFDQAVLASPEAVSKLFKKDGVGSLGSRLDGLLSNAVGGPSTLLDARAKSLNDRLAALQKDRARLDLRLADVERNYRRQFTALDGLVAQLQSTQSFLTRELARLPGGS